MALEMRQTLRLAQQLIMTPQLQQAIKLLQLSRMELIEVVQQEIQENPLLEEAPEIPEGLEGKNALEASLTKAEADLGGEGKTDNNPDNIDWVSYIQRSSLAGYSSMQEDEERADTEPILTTPPSLFDHLLWQLHMQRLSEHEEQAAAVIVGNLNDEGYLSLPLEEIAARNELSPEAVARGLTLVQDLDPPGVGARDLRECLLLQIRNLGLTGTAMEKVVADHMNELERHNYKGIAQKVGIGIQEAAEIAKQIGMLEPRPGRPFGGDEPRYITPDVYVFKIGDEYIVVLNDDGMPHLRISSYYKNVLSRKDAASEGDREYIKNKLRSAVWLIRSIHQRQRTIHKVATSIVNFQREFLDRGVGYLKPLILRDVAEDIHMHESSVSRVTTNKYVHTPQGIYELKYFFNSGISSSSGEFVASESVKHRIQQIIGKEEVKKPLSDQDIVNILEREGIRIARRTVTKYREMLSILSSSKRRRLY